MWNSLFLALSILLSFLLLSLLVFLPSALHPSPSSSFPHPPCIFSPCHSLFQLHALSLSRSLIPKCFERVHALNPTDPAALHELASLHRAEGQSVHDIERVGGEKIDALVVVVVMVVVVMIKKKLKKGEEAVVVEEEAFFF